MSVPMQPVGIVRRTGWEGRWRLTLVLWLWPRGNVADQPQLPHWHLPRRGRIAKSIGRMTKSIAVVWGWVDVER